MRFNFTLLAILAACSFAFAQEPVEPMLISLSDSDTPVEPVSVIDSLLSLYPEPTEQLVSKAPLPRVFFLPAVFDTYRIPEATSAFTPDYSGNPSLRWIEDANAVERRSRGYLQQLFVNHPEAVPYNIGMLPEAPKQYIATVNPEEHTIEIREVVPELPAEPTLQAQQVKPRHWIRDFKASLQFSQAYISPNWYQGGNNNLNMLLNLYYNVKLNQSYHPNLLFESTFQYKLGMNSAPDDSLRNYSINEDVFQINSTFGIKAAKRWYYSLTAQFKTQLFNAYKSNTTTLRSAFMSPAELNAGLGMTYNYANAKKTFTFDASIAPLSYNMRVCTNSRLNVTEFGIEAGHKTVHKFGSSAEMKITWKISYNISYSSRLFAFTDYKRAYADWENTLMFEINKFLTTQIFANFRYDTDTPPSSDPSWHKLQVKEILSIGFFYKFSTL